MPRLQSRGRLKLVMRAFVLAVIAVGFVPSEMAQLSTASVTGVVRDQSGSVVTGAKLTLTNIETAVKHESVSNSPSNYLFLSIPPGQYFGAQF